MAIATLDGVIAGAQPPEHFFKTTTNMEAIGVHHSLAYTPGLPGAASVPTSAMSGSALTSYGGQLNFTNPVSGNTYLMRFDVRAGNVGVLFLYDRLWHNSGIAVTTTTSQTINSAAWPARDKNGSTNGEGVLVGIEVSTATTNVSAITNTTMTYTNSDGTSSRTATIRSFPGTAVAGTFVPFLLDTGDKGVRSIQSITLGTSYGGGEIHLVAYRHLAQLSVLDANTGDSLDALTGGMVRMYNNTVPFLVWLASTATAISIAGTFIVTQG